jgi:hypothetical protein
MKKKVPGGLRELFFCAEIARSGYFAEKYYVMEKPSIAVPIGAEKR